MTTFAVAAETAERRPALDPRSKILLVLLAGVAVMSPGGLVFVPAGIVLGTVLALTERAWRRAFVLLASAGVLYVLGWLLPLWWTNAVTVTAALAGGYLIRFVVAVGIGAHLVATTSPTMLGAALQAWRTPRALAVPLAVMLRFFPVVASESASVLDAMRLRGLAGASGLARHPILGIERFAVPMIAASLRASEDLAASAIVRGLGSRRSPVSLVPPRFGAADLALVALVAALVVATLILPQPLGGPA